jgi:hypothetical protein
MLEILSMYHIINNNQNIYWWRTYKKYRPIDKSAGSYFLVIRIIIIQLINNVINIKDTSFIDTS